MYIKSNQELKNKLDSLQIEHTDKQVMSYRKILQVNSLLINRYCLQEGLTSKQLIDKQVMSYRKGLLVNRLLINR